MACGDNGRGQCDVPPNPADGDHLGYVAPRAPHGSLPVLALQASFDGASPILATMAGKEFCMIRAASADFLSDVCVELARRLAGSLGSDFSRVEVVLPGAIRPGGLALERPGIRIEGVFTA